MRPHQPHRPPGTIQRSKGIGGSDIGAICGFSRYKTPLQVYLEKRGEIPEEMTDSPRLRFGRRLEKPVADEFAFVTGRKLWRERKTIRHPEIPYFLANIDRWQSRQSANREEDLDRGVYEGKTADWTQRSLWLQGGVPDAYYVQLQWYLMVTGCLYGSYGILFGLSDFHFFDVARDEPAIETLRNIGLDFWRRVKEGNPPDEKYGEAGKDLVRRLFPKSTPKKQMLLSGAETEAKVRRLLQLKQAIKARESEERDLVIWLQHQMQDAEVAIFPELAKITWSTTSQKRIDIPRLRRDYPLVVDAIETTSISRRFLITADMAAQIEEESTEDAPLMIMTGVRQIQLD